MTSLWIALEDLAPQHQMLGVTKLYIEAKEVSHKDLKGFHIAKAIQTFEGKHNKW